MAFNKNARFANLVLSSWIYWMRLCGQCFHQSHFSSELLYVGGLVRFVVSWLIRTEATIRNYSGYYLPLFRTRTNYESLQITHPPFFVKHSRIYQLNLTIRLKFKLAVCDEILIHPRRNVCIKNLTANKIIVLSWLVMKMLDTNESVTVENKLAYK